MAVDIFDAFVQSMKPVKGGGVLTTVKELRENQFGFPLRHYAQQYLFGATGLRIHVFNSIQGAKESGKSTFLFDLMGQILQSEDDGGLGGIAVLYELEDKISPTILHSILSGYGERPQKTCFIQRGFTLEKALEDLNTNVIPAYRSICPKRDKPIIVGFDSIGGAASEDIVKKVVEDGSASKGFHDKPHIMKHWCENQTQVFFRERIPIVVVCINQEKVGTPAPGQMIAPKVITGGASQLFKDGHMISVSKRALSRGGGNVMTLKTTKTSFCDDRRIELDFRWNLQGKNSDDAYEARFLWGLAAAKCFYDVSKSRATLKDILEVSISDKELVTCPRLGLRSVLPDEFESALFANGDVLEEVYTAHKIEKLRDLSGYAEYSAGKPAKNEEPKPKKGKKKEEQEETPKEE